MQVSLGVDLVLLVGAGLLLVAVLVSTVLTTSARRLRVPGALLFLGLGMLAGNDGWGCCGCPSRRWSKTSAWWPCCSSSSKAG